MGFMHTRSRHGQCKEKAAQRNVGSSTLGRTRYQVRMGVGSEAPLHFLRHHESSVRPKVALLWRRATASPLLALSCWPSWDSSLSATHRGVHFHVRLKLAPCTTFGTWESSVLHLCSRRDVKNPMMGVWSSRSHQAVWLASCWHHEQPLTA